MEEYGEKTFGESTYVAVELPFQMTVDDLKLDPASLDHDRTDLLESRIQWLALYASGHEVERILRSAVVLHTVTREHFGRCLDTAIIWERG